jgi:hypothetical protein
MLVASPPFSHEDGLELAAAGGERGTSGRGVRQGDDRLDARLGDPGRARTSSS